MIKRLKILVKHYNKWEPLQWAVMTEIVERPASSQYFILKLKAFSQLGLYILLIPLQLNQLVALLA